MSNHFMSWPNKWFGVFRDPNDSDTAYPVLSDFQDEDWYPKDRDRLVEYLKQAPNVIATSAGKMRCEVCRAELPLGAYKSDGVWLWPDGLEHYVSEHSLRLPEALVIWIRQNSYIPPEECAVPIEALPWP